MLLAWVWRGENIILVWGFGALGNLECSEALEGSKGALRG